MKNKLLLTLLISSIQTLNLFGQSPDYEWGMGFININSQYLGVETDAMQNVITYSTYYLTEDLDPSAGTATITGAGSMDFYFAKYDANRNFLWKRSFGAANNEIIEDVATDSDQNIYITGEFQNGMVDFNPAFPGTTVISASGTVKYDIFLAKYNPNGELIWIKTMPNPSTDENAMNLELDGSNNIYLSGFFTGTCDFDPSPATFNLTSMAGNKDIYVAKYDSNGNFNWAKQITGSTYFELSGMKIDHNNDLIVTSLFLDNANYNPTGTGGSFTSMNHNPTAITKFSSAGNYLWTKILDGPNSDAYVDVNGLVVDAANNIYFAAYYEGTTDFDPSSNTVFVPALPGYGCGLFAKYDANGNYIFAKMLGAGGTGAIDVDAANNIYVAGGFYNTIDFDFSANIENRTSTGMSDVFIAKYDQNVNLMYVFSTGGTANDVFTGLDVRGNNEIYLFGYTNNTNVDFDPSANSQSFTHEATSFGYSFWLKYNQCTPSTGTFTHSACGAYTWIDGVTYTASNNTATHTIPAGAANGCDSIVTLNLTINQPVTGTFTHNACGAYTWINGVTYTASNNTATHTIPAGAANGCDSIVTLNLTINQPATGTFTHSACGSYTWINGVTYTASNNTATHTIPAGAANGCDSIVTLNLTINQPATGTFTHSTCGAYTWINGVTYTASNNTATHTIPAGAANGCDSIVTLNLTINQPVTGTFTHSTCGAYTWINGVTYTASNNTATHTIPAGAANGCDSIVTLNLTINQPATGTFTHSACGSYTWINGVTYTASNNTATHTIPAGAANGCDSIVTLNLTINQPVTGTFTHSACGAYTWINGVTYTASNNTAMHTIPAGAANGCDSIVTLNLTINQPITGTFTHSACGAYTWINGVTYTASNNTATHTIPAGAANGCDSIVTLNLTITHVNTTTSVNGITISSNANNATYIWLNCNNGMSIIPNQTEQTFNPEANGIYAVEVTQNGCTDTSSCIAITSVSLDENSTEKTRLYPNPTSGKFTLESYTNPSIVSIYSIAGRLIESRKTEDQDQHSITFELDQPSGVYFVEVLNQKGQKIIFKVVKE
jgi:hypothetical protein